MSSSQRFTVISAFVLLGAVLTTACASTGGTPRPFPTPGSHPKRPEPTPGTSVTGSTPAGEYELVGTALALRGVPYRNGGTDTKGFDCSGFTQYVFAQHGIALPRDVRDQFRSGKPIDRKALEPGDLIFFTTTERGASHVAIVVGGDSFVHAPSTSGVVRVERLSSAYWSPRYVGSRRVLGN